MRVTIPQGSEVTIEQVTEELQRETDLQKVADKFQVTIDSDNGKKTYYPINKQSFWKRILQWAKSLTTSMKH